MATAFVAETVMSSFVPQLLGESRMCFLAVSRYMFDANDASVSCASHDLEVVFMLLKFVFQ